MKSKPVKHKTTNTFRFIPFAERINNIDIRHAALYHVEHINVDQPEENETHFHVALRKWFSLNLTESFKKFRKEVFGIVTLPQLVHKKDDVLEILEKYLKHEDQLCLQPLLEILVGIAKDLREDFYPHFPKFLDILIQLLETKDAEKLEWTLISLAFLFKILKPYLKRDLAAVLKRIVPLLSEKKPQYINNFAAESFAFVARDIRDKKKFIHLIVNYLTTHEDAITGCGHLLFEIVRGVPGKFHSCIESFIPLLLQHLKEQRDHQSILFRVLTQTIEDILQAVSHTEFKFFWTSVTTYTEEILKEGYEENKGLEYILRLAGQVIEHHNGKYLSNPPEFVLLLIKVVCEQSSENVLEVCAQIGALLLLSSNITLSQEHAGIIVKVLLPLPFPNILINFVKNVIEYSQFDMHILPHFLNFVVQSNFDAEAMNTLTKICLRKSPLSKNGINLFEWVKYPIDFGNRLHLFQKYLDTVLSENIDNIMENPRNLINILICLPHVEKIDVNHTLVKLRDIVSRFLTVLSAYNIESHKLENKYHTNTSILAKGARKILFVVGNTIECAVHISNCKGIKEFCDIDKLLLILLPCAVDPNYVAALHTLDLYLTAYEHENGLRMPLLSLVDSYLRENLCSPFHVVRLLTTHIYKLFENIEEMKKSGQVGSTTEQLQVFSLCYNVEAIKPSIQEYRTQINMLQKLTFNTAQYALLKDTGFGLNALVYMMGVLYMNFKLLWEPVTEFIAGYGNALPADEFWPVFLTALQSSFDNANKDLKNFNFNEELEAIQADIHDIYADYNTIDERPDLPNYRNLILNIMTQCPQVCEAKNRDVVPIFLSFIDNQYRREDRQNALKADLEEHVKTVEDETIEDENIENIDISEVEDQKETVSGKIIFKTLIKVMQVLSNFKNPRALYREPEFWHIFMDFLRNKNPGLQKYALDCVMNYKIKSLLPYKDNLYNLVDEKKFKDEMTLFKITEDSQSIHQEDREHIIPIIIRILYGKMTTKLGADKKGGGQTRRSLVMRYLAGCRENELKMFIDIAFAHMQQYLTMTPNEIYDDIKDKLDLKSVTSPGKLHSTLNLFEVVREYFGGYMKEDLLRHIFKTFYALSSTIAVVLSKDNVHIGYVKVMKNLRIVALSIIRKLFEQFDKYKWDTEELDVIFNTLIWPLLTKLHGDGIHSPTALLKLLNTWCLNPRYYVLLITHPDNNPSQTPIDGIFKLLLNPKTNVNVVNFILDMIEKVLTLIEDDKDKETPSINTSHSLHVDVVTTQRNINFGSKLLIPHIPQILEVMKRRIANSAKSSTVNKRDLLILSRVTELVSTPELCDELLNLLLPILVKKVCMNMAEENMEYAITTIINLLNHSKSPHVYIKNIAVLFNKVTLVEVRKLLLNTLRSIAANSSENKKVLNRLADVITEMNAFNKRWIDQPDFDRRLDAYKEIYRLSETSEIDIDLAILIVNNCFYFVRTEKDIGLRDSAGLCLKRILPKLMLKYRSVKNGDVFVRDTVLSLISNGIRDNKSEVHRNEAISLLGDLVRECPDADVVLTDLVPLTNKEDVEVDFFENMCHLQMHRHVRALLKFSKVFKKVVKCPTPRTITNFILPLATMYICDDKYTDKNTLIDACIEVVSTSCRLLPWYHYEVILKLYLNKLRHTSEHQKQLTRILVGILDAFHFDFSKVKAIELPKSLTNNLDIGNIFKKKSKVEKGSKNKEEEVMDPKMDIDETENKNEHDNELAPENDENVEQTLDETQVDEKLKEADEKDCEESLQPLDLTTPAFERVTTVSPSVANRIIKSLAAGLLPQLSRSIGRMTDHEESHKVNRRRTGLERQEQDMQRVPIALALVKLLQRLPGDVLRYHLAGIIIKLCSFLKSPLKQVRIAARDIVKKIMTTVGTSYLEILLQHLTMLLTRGFQVHVLVATIHVVLDALKTEFKPGEIDKCLTLILDVCTNDLFGALSEEKEVDKLQNKMPEAKPSKKSYVSLMIVAQNITEKVLIKLLLPFKDVLQKHHSKKVVMKVQEALTHISAGLVTNKFLNIESLIIFLHGIASESIPEFVLGAPKREITDAQKEKMLIVRPDCFIIPVAPKRNKEVQAKHVKTSARANSHVLVEFSLNILYVILKREKVPRANCIAFVDPLIPILVDSLKSDHIKVTTVAMKCLTTLWTIRISTPALTECIKDIVTTIFTILHKYATFEISKQNDNFNLVRNAFKAVTVLLRNVKYYSLETDQLKTLLLYAEEDCQNDEKPNTSFTLLKAILDAKLVSPELHEVMEKVAKICILSDSYKSREEARQIFVTYITNYTPGKKMEKFIQFFVSQLNYELQHGRESALKFLDMIIHKFQVPQLSKQSDYLLLSLAACMVNDPAPECRAAAAASIENMLKRFPGQDRNKLFDLVLTFFQDSQPIHIELAAQLSIRFVNIEKEDFKTRLDTLLPTIYSKILLLSYDMSEGRFVKLQPDQSEDKTDEEKQKEKDHSLIQLLNLIDRIANECPAILKQSKYFSEWDDIAQHCQILLAYPHSWVRIRAAKIISHILSTVDGTEIEDLIKGRTESDRGFIYYDTENILRGLVLDLCAQFTPGVSKEMAEQVTSVLFQILKLILSIPSFKVHKKLQATDIDSEGGGRVNIRWITFKMKKAINAEVAKAPLTTNIRESILATWMHLISILDSEDLNSIIDVILSPLVRELSTGNAAAPASLVRQLATRLGKKLRRKIGDIEYGKLAAEAQTKLNIRRAERKKLILQEKVHNPEKAAKRKLQLKEKKKIAKKIKMEMLQGKRPRAKKRKAADIDLEDELLRDD